MLISIVVGVFSGLMASLFFLGIEGCRHFVINQMAGIGMPAPSGEELFTGHLGQKRAWVIPIGTTLVGLLTGWLIHRFLPETKEVQATDGTDTMTHAFHYKEGQIRPMEFLIKGSTSVLTIGSGGSAGREGPITLLGAGLGSWFSRVFRLSSRERRIFLLSGAGGGLGAIFRAPLGGAITGVEIIYKEDFESEALLPAILSSVFSYTIFTLVYGSEPIFDIPRFSFNPNELIFYFFLALFCAFTGWLYIRCFYLIKYSIFEKLKQKIGLILTTGLGGFFMGCLGMVFPQLLSGGYGYVELAILGELSLLAMALMLIGKTIATSITLGSGMSGGMFAPALFVGGMSGGIIGQLCCMEFPQIVSHPGSYVLVGMAAFFAGAGRAPIGPFILVTELTQGYGLLAPLMLCSAVCLFFNRKYSIYQNQTENKFNTPAHSGELFEDILETHTVSELVPQLRQVYTVTENMNFSEFKQLFRNTEQHYFPVIDEQGRLKGVFSSTDFRSVLFDEDIENLVLVKDMSIPNFIFTTPSEDLSSVMNKFTEKNIDALPVVEDRDHTRLMGMLRRREVIAFYNDTLEQKKLHKNEHTFNE